MKKKSNYVGLCFLLGCLILSVDVLASAIDMCSFDEIVYGTPAREINFTCNNTTLMIQTFPSERRTKIIYFLFDISESFNSSFELDFSIFNQIEIPGKFGRRIVSALMICDKLPDTFCYNSTGNPYECHWNYSSANCSGVRLREEFEGPTVTFVAGYERIKLHCCCCERHSYSIISSDKKTYLLMDGTPVLESNQSILPKVMIIEAWGWDYTERTLHIFENLKFNTTETKEITHEKMYLCKNNLTQNPFFIANFGSRNYSYSDIVIINTTSTHDIVDFLFNKSQCEGLDSLNFKKLFRRQSCNILVVTTPDFPFGEKIAEKFDACLLVINETTNATKAKEEIVNFIDELNKNGTFINSTEFYTKGVYLILTGSVPTFKLEDPVEKQKLLGLIEVSDKEDGEYFYSDLPYGDLNNDNYIDIPVSRYPNDEGISSLMLFYSDIYLPKNALVVSEYMHTNWLSILLNGGGNMWTGRTVASYLSRDGWKVSRLVEARMPEPEKFISQFDPLELQDFMDKQQKLVEILERLIGKTISSVVGKILSVLKIAQISENGFEAYLEYDWKSTKFDREKFMNLLADLNLSENVPFEVAKVIALSVWPNHWPILNKENLISYFNNSSAVFYLGFGNSTHLILPNEIPKDLGFLDWKEFFVDRYNGSEYLSYTELPIKFYKLVWNDASLSAFGNFGDEFRKRTETYIAPSALTYYHFSSEILTRFLKNEYTVGRAFIKAINDFYDDRFTWDPFSFNKPGIKSKVLREYFVFGDPTLFKDPEIDKPNTNESLICSDFCTFSFSFKANYSVVEIDNKSLVLFNDPEIVFEEGKPLVNIKKIKFYLPKESNFSLEIKHSSSLIQNPYLPTFELVSTNGETLNYSLILNETFPKEDFYVHTHETIDGRKEIAILVPLIKFNPNNTASIISQFNGVLKYKPLIDFNLSLGNINIGEKNFFRMFVFNNLNESKEILVICNLNHQSFRESFEKRFEVNPGLTSLEIEKKLPKEGNYKLECYLKYNPVIGPRILYFEAVRKNEELESETISKNGKAEETVYYVAKYNPPELPNESNTIETYVTNKTEENVSVCGNGICEENETFEDCAEDCFVGPQPIENRDITNISHSEKATGFFVLSTNKLIGVILSIVVGIVLVVLWLEKLR